MFARLTNALKRSDSDASTATQQQDGPAQDTNVLSPPDSISRNGSKMGHLRSLSRSQDKDNSGSLTFAKRVKSSLHLNSNINGTFKNHASFLLKQTVAYWLAHSRF